MPISTPSNLKGLKIHSFPGMDKRDPRLPAIYKYVGEDRNKKSKGGKQSWEMGLHPQRLVRHPYVGSELPKCYRTKGDTYVILVDTSPEGKQAAQDLGHSLGIPPGREANIGAQYGGSQ